MAKIVSDKTGSKGPVGSKASSRLPGILRGPQASTPSRSSGGPRGVVTTKPAGRLRSFFREVKVEMSKVTWPSRKDLLTATGVVIVAVIIAGIFIGVFDFIWTTVVHAVGLG